MNATCSARGQLRERLAVLGLACAVDGIQRRAVEIHERRTHVRDADVQQRVVRRHRALLIDEMRDAGLARAGNQRFADGFEPQRLVGAQHLERDFLRSGFAWQQQNFNTADGECQRTRRGAPHECAAPDIVHGVLPSSVLDGRFAFHSLCPPSPAGSGEGYCRCSQQSPGIFIILNRWKIAHGPAGGSASPPLLRDHFLSPADSATRAHCAISVLI